MSINFKVTKSDLVSNLKNCIDNWCNKSGIQKSNRSEWKKNVITLVDENILEQSKEPRYNIIPFQC